MEHPAEVQSPKVLVILGHPRPDDSFCAALAEAYAEGARQAGLRVERLDLARLRFDPVLRHPSPRDQALEPDLLRAQELIFWADHLVFAYPAWWGTLPALLKGFLDRVLVPGSAFEASASEPTGWRGLLGGRSAQLLVTMDTPAWVYRFAYRQPGHQAMRRATLGFCGIRPTFAATFGPLLRSSEAARRHWLDQARRMPQELPRRLRAARRRARAGAWIRLARLQFYPMTWVAYTVGALAACRGPGDLSSGVYWLGYLCLFLVELLTVISNEWFDQGTDRLNENAGPFNGGSRVLVRTELEPASVRRAMIGVTILAGLALGALWAAIPAAAEPAFLPLAALALLAPAYTMPPLRLAYRGLGELEVGLTHSFAAILSGSLLQAASWRDPFPWLIGVPLFLATLGAITLSALPDHDADKAAAKRTLAVLLGPRRAALAAMGLVASAVLCGLLWRWKGLYGGWSGLAIFLAVPHAVLLIGAIRRHLRRGAPCIRIDGIMLLALTYLLWFGLIPLAALS